MMKILRAYGVPLKVISQINAMYVGTTSAVRSEDGTSDFFEIRTGVLQGDTLAPFLFIIMIDYVMRTAIDKLSIYDVDVGITIVPSKRGTARTGSIPAIVLSDLDFADDIVLCTGNIENNQKFLDAVEFCAADIGLFINRKKTEFIAVGRALLACSVGLSVKEGSIKQVDDFKYLGSWIMNSKKDIGVRIGIAWSTIKKLNKVWKSQLERGFKIEIYNSLIQSVLLYSCETWSLTKTLEKQLNGARNRLLRYALNISWKEKLPNSIVFEGVIPISEIVRSRRVRFAGHCLRAWDQPVRHLVLWKGNGNKAKGAKNFSILEYYVKILCI